MKEFMLELLQAVITAVVPIVAGYICALLSRKAAEAAERTENARVKRLLEHATQAATTAVQFVAQTYVDGLKKSGTFSAENQKEAFGVAYRYAVELMEDDAIALIEESFGGMESWLTAQIERAVRETKNA